MLRCAASQRVAGRLQASRNAWQPHRHSKHRPARTSVVLRVTDVNQSTFEEEVLQSDLPVLVDFWAPWCGPCKLVAPQMEWAEAEYSSVLKVVKVEHDPNPDLVSQYKVYGLPCLVLFRDGAQIDGSLREGAVTRVQLKAYLTEFGILDPEA